MKKILTYFVVAGLSLSLTCATQNGANIHNKSTIHANMPDTPSARVLIDMHEAMVKAGFCQSGDVELDFIANMIPHHQGAVDSSKTLLKHSKNDQIRQIAQNIIKDQEKEIAEFNEMVANKSYTNTPVSDDDYKKFVEDEKKFMDLMMTEMNKVKPSENIDKDFLEAMIEHHQGAVDVSKQILEYSKDEKIRQIAQNIIQAQEREIAEFSEIIKGL